MAPKSRGWGFHEVDVRKGDFAMVAAAATLQEDAGKFRRVRSPLRAWEPMRSPQASEKALNGRKADDAAFAKLRGLCSRNRS